MGSRLAGMDECLCPRVWVNDFPNLLEGQIVGCQIFDCR